MYICVRIDIVRRRVCLEGIAFILSAFCLLGASATCAQVKQTRRVLVINALGPLSPAYARMDEEIRTDLDKSPYQVELYHEYLETVLFSGDSTQKVVGDSIIQKYRNQKIDLIITVGLSALRFMNDSHRTFFPDAPVVFCGGIEQYAGDLALAIGGGVDIAVSSKIAIRLVDADYELTRFGNNFSGGNSSQSNFCFQTGVQFRF